MRWGDAVNAGADMLACPLFSVRPDWESVGFDAVAGLSVLGRGLVAKA
jgi:hypothetical protein